MGDQAEALAATYPVPTVVGCPLCGRRHLGDRDHRSLARRSLELSEAGADDVLDITARAEGPPRPGDEDDPYGDKDIGEGVAGLFDAMMIYVEWLGYTRMKWNFDSNVIVKMILRWFV